MIYVELPGLPLTDNHAYFTLPKRRKADGKKASGGRALTKAGKEYKLNVRNAIIKSHPSALREIRKNSTVGIVIALGFTDIYNKGYPNETSTRYKRQDVLNRTKLLNDAIGDAVSYDDSQIVISGPHWKYEAQREETKFYIWNEDDFPIGRALVDTFAKLIGFPRPV